MRVLQSKEKLLTDLRKELQITREEHFEVLTAVMQDKELEALRENKVLEPQAANVDSGLKRKKEAMGGSRCASPALHNCSRPFLLSAAAEECYC